MSNLIKSKEKVQITLSGILYGGRGNNGDCIFDFTFTGPLVKCMIAIDQELLGNFAENLEDKKEEDGKVSVVDTIVLFAGELNQAEEYSVNQCVIKFIGSKKRDDIHVVSRNDKIYKKVVLVK